MDSHPLPPRATNDDQSRRVATTPDSSFTLSTEDALRRYTDAGLPRTPRSIQRYCALGHLECRRIDTSYGQKWVVTPESVDRHIAYIKEVMLTTGRDASRQVAAGRDTNEAEPAVGKDGKTTSDAQPPTVSSDDPSRHVATADRTADGSRFNNQLKSENEFLRDQIVVKDAQIKELTERARETNHLIAGLQHMLSPLLGPSHHHVDDRPREEKGAG